MIDETQSETQSSPNLSTEPGEKGKAPNAGTKTQPAPNLSTEHQKEGDGRSSSDTLDGGQTNTPGGQPVGEVADRPNVSTVTPDEYPSDRPNNRMVWAHHEM